MDDPLRLIGAVTRDVRRCERDGQPGRAVIASRTYDTTIEDLWDALTNAERIPRWFLPVSGDLRPGGRFQLQGNAGGEILRCERPALLAVTWEGAGAVSWVTVRLEPREAGRTRLELEHVALITPEGAAFWDQFGPGAVGVGWDGALMGLGRHLETGAPVDPAAAAAWSMSDEGKAFMRGCSDAWAEAAIADGADAAWARAAAARTSAFYTGEPPPAGA